MRDWGHLIALALFAAVGSLAFDDYGISVDSIAQRGIGNAAVRYIMGDEDALLGDEDARTGNYSERFNGVVFEVPLVVAERILGLKGSRARFLSRHLLTHLLFLAAGFFAWLLARRLFGSRLIALIVMLLFLLHPRMYAHSFFNSKDLPFLSAFMVALYLIHRAFRRDSARAFALCGAGAGVLTGVRIIGLMLVPAVLGMLALDAFFAMRRGERDGARHALVNAGAFLAAAAATVYAVTPALWRDPLSLIEGFGVLARHPLPIATLFRGEAVHLPNLPWDYVPTWMLITTPPVALILAAIGAAYLARICAVRWRGALANSTARFGLLAAACLILPVVAVVLLNSNLYNGWRHMYFLYAPLCVLAAFGLRALAAIPKPSLRAAALSLAAVGLALAAAQIVRLHPYQSDYFNALADKRGLAERWEMDYWGISYREALETLLETLPTGRIAVSGHEIHLAHNMRLIPADERRRLYVSLAFPSFRIVSGDELDGGGHEVVWEREIYGVPIVSILDERAKSAAAMRAVYAAARASEPAASAGGFDMYADGDNLIYIKEDCGEDEARSRFALSAFPVDPSDLPWPTRDAGYSEYEPLDFDFPRYGAIFDGKCVIVRGLPEYPMTRVETSQRAPGESGAAWSVKIRMGGYVEKFRRALSSLSGEPSARSGFDMWLDGGRLIYVKENCGEGDTRGRFFLSVFPADPTDLPQSARDDGFAHEPLNFDFHDYGAIFDGKCVIIRELPDYPISRVETGQWIPGEGELWSVGVVVGG